MGRLPKTGVDYFPHDVLAALQPTLFTVQEKFQNTGYAFWFKLLEFTGSKAGLYCDFSTPKDWEYFLSFAKVDEQTAEAILTLLVKLDAIDEELWTKRRVVWINNFAERLTPVYAKRGCSTPERPTFDDAPEVDVGAKVVVETKVTEVHPKKKTKTKTDDDSEKKQYAEFVKMTEGEYKALVEKCGSEAAARKCIETLDNYKGSSGKTYKSDYRAILNWVIERVQKDHKELFQATASLPPNDDGDGNPFADCE